MSTKWSRRVSWAHGTVMQINVTASVSNNIHPCFWSRKTFFRWHDSAYVKCQIRNVCDTEKYFFYSNSGSYWYDFITPALWMLLSTPVNTPYVNLSLQGPRFSYVLSSLSASMKRCQFLTIDFIPCFCSLWKKNTTGKKRSNFPAKCAFIYWQFLHLDCGESLWGFV